MITGRTPAGGGGLESYVRAHGLAAARAGFEVHLFSIGRHDLTRATEFGTLHEVGVPIPLIRMPLARLHSRAFARAVRAAVANRHDGRPVIVHCFGAWAECGRVAVRALERRGIASVLVVSVFTTVAHEQQAKVAGLRATAGPLNVARYVGLLAATRLFGSRDERRGLRAARVLLYNYDSVRDIVLAEHGRHPDMRKIPYASDVAFGDSDRPAAIPEPLAALRPAGAPLILCVSRHDPRKGVEILLRSLAALARSGVEYRACFLGRGELIEQHRRLVRRLRISDRVAITGVVPDVVPYLRAADIFVLPSLEEGSGSLSLIEALQHGVAAIASACDGVPEDVRDGDDALLVAPGDGPALTAALRRLLGDPALRRELGARAHATYERRFSSDAFVEALAGVYREVGTRREPAGRGG